MEFNYKNYIGKVVFDEAAETFHGRVINIADIVTFEGSSVAELKQAFVDSVDEYLAFCNELGEEPEKPQ
jgi:predicted HicB family RNase H-like nuclease